jgi:hypothetical protein
MSLTGNCVFTCLPPSLNVLLEGWAHNRFPLCFQHPGAGIQQVLGVYSLTA